MKRHSKALGRLVARFEARAAKKSGTVEKYEFWGLVVLVACQITFFVTPTVDMVGQMGLARSKNIKAMLANGWVITVITFAYVLVRALLYVA